MRSRIVVAIVGVTALTVLVLGIPLAVIVQRFYEGKAFVELQRQAALAVGEVTLPLDTDVLRTAFAEPDDPTGVTVYDADGRRLVGPGPSDPDDAVRQALGGDPATGSSSGALVAATPISDRSIERVVGAVRVTTPQRVLSNTVERAWLLMAAAAILAVLGAWWIARHVARRLSGPIELLGHRAQLLGAGTLSTTPHVSGIREIDAVDQVLVDSGRKIAEVLARERSFTADVSHQVRTPLTRLAILVDRARGPDPIGPSLDAIDDELDRLHGVIDHLLALARNNMPSAAVTDPHDLLDRLTQRWQAQVATLDRSLAVTRTTNLEPVAASPAALDQALDVLVDNALVHGTGTVHLLARRTTGAVVFEVTDEGPSVDGASLHRLSDQRATGSTGSGHGIGLALARSIVEAEGGRLLLAQASPPTFHIVVRVRPSEGSASP